jgi:predicted ATP-dependent endonuclease of OLD family
MIDGLGVAEIHESFRALTTLNAALAAVSASDEEGSPDNVQRTALKNALAAAGLSQKKSIDDRVWDLLQERLPRFFRFTQYSGLPGRIDLQVLNAKSEDGPGSSDMQAARALLKLAGTDLKQLSNEDYELRKSELEAVQIDLTNQVFEYWKQNPDLEVQIDVDKKTINTHQGQQVVARYLDIRLRDQRTGYSNNFSQRSSGFQWFFSFLAAFSEFEEHNAPIVLLDEPALTLHGKAQADFLRFINGSRHDAFAVHDRAGPAGARSYC